MRFKSVLGAFLFVLAASAAAFLIFIHTKSFGALVTKVVTDVSEKRLGTRVKVKSFSLSFFPPGLELNKVQIKKKISEDESFSTEFGKIGFYLNIFELEEKKLTFGELRIADSTIEYRFPARDEPMKEIDRKLIDRVFRSIEEAPLRIDTVLVENLQISLNHDLVEARRIKLIKNPKSFTARFHLANLQPFPEKDFTLDEVWGDAEITRNDIGLYRLKLIHDVQTLLLKGRVTNYHQLLNAEAAFHGEAQLHLESMNRDFPLPDKIQIQGGNAKAGFNLTYTQKKVHGRLDIFLQNLRSNLLYGDELRTLVVISDKKISIDKLSLVHKAERAHLVEPVLVADLAAGSYLAEPLRLQVENFGLNNALRVLGPSLTPLKGELTGDLDVRFSHGDLYFVPRDKFLVTNLGLVVGGKKDPFSVLMIKRALISDAQFAVVKNEFKMTALAELARSKLQIDGSIGKSGVDFRVNKATVNLEDFGNISQLNIKGAGELSVKVSGALDNVELNLTGKTKGFEILGYKLGETEKDISIELESKTVVIRKMEATLGKTHLSGDGTVNYGDAEIALGISAAKTNMADLEQILHPIFKDLKFLPADLDFKAKVEVDIFGQYRLDNLKIRSLVNFTDLTAYGENLNSGSFNISLLNRMLEFKNIEAEKGRGTIEGNFLFGLKDKSMKLKFDWDNIDLTGFNLARKLNLNLNAQLTGQLSGGGTTDHYNLKMETLAFDTKTSNYSFDDSHMSMTILPDRLVGKANFLGNTLTSEFNLALKQGLASQLKLRLETVDLKPLLVGVFGQHLESESFTGKINFEGETSFQNGFKHLDLTGRLVELDFNHPEFNVNYQSSSPEFIVRDSVIQRWNLAIRQPDLFVLTSAEGIFGKQVTLIQDVHFNAKILEILLSPVLSSEGFVRNSIRIDGRGTDLDLLVSSKATDLNLSIEQLPVQLNHLAYDLSYAGGRVSVENLSTSLDSGKVSIKGDVFFDSPQPDVNLKYSLENAEIPVLGKSSVNLSGEGIILGNNFPYAISGEIVVNKAQILNELNEFSSKSSAFSQVRFLPKNQESAVGKVFDLNLNVKSELPIRLTNSLMDVGLVGEVRLLGNPLRPRAEGRLSTPPSSSRIFFKNSEYLITRGDINFSSKKEISNPDFDVQALTFISTYKVIPKAYGDLERFNFDLTSDPPLPRNSILSLIAFGYTNEIQNNLQSKDQQSLTNVGVGSFVFDRFKISDILNKQFGLQVNLGTVIEQSATDSLLTGRSQEGQFGQGGGAIGRTRSATKIELKKRLNEAVTLSVSSTMGGSIGQRQSMNLNYGVTKNVQLEGVYELRTNQFGQEDIIYNSIGGDIKFRRTFP